MNDAETLNMRLRFMWLRGCDPLVCDDWARRRGEFQGCEKPAVALRRDGDGNPYPVCVHHARVDAMVPLADILAALIGDPT